MKILFRFVPLCLLLIASCAAAEPMELTRQPVAAPKELPGLFTLILIGEGGGSSNAERVALFDREGDVYSFRPVTPAY
ncbi:MAG TPA: hypothetical protein VLA15_03905, partial [Desulfurivibrionaceae bacterium]|nr:hypothetical protein [Desulfurivibrionaceae bacterium]